MVIIFFLFFLLFVRPVCSESMIKINSFSATSSEFIELINNSSNEINLESWTIKNDNFLDDDIHLNNTHIIPANSTQKFYNENKQSWLNDSGDIIYLYDKENNLIDKLSYPLSTSTTTLTSTPTFIPTPTSIPSPSPTSDSTLVNPESGIILTEFMPYSFIEWIEVFNDNDKPVELINWVIKDSSTNIKSISNLKIASKSYAIFEFSSFLNNDTDKIIFINHNNQIISQYEYPDNKFTLERSWSLINGSWCQSTITKNSSNASSCYQAPTSIPTIAPITITPTILLNPTAIPTDRNLYKLDESATASAVNTPTEETSYYLTPTISIAPISSNLVLGETTTAKKNYLPLIFIITGGLLLISPLIIDKLKKR